VPSARTPRGSSWADRCRTARESTSGLSASTCFGIHRWCISINVRVVRQHIVPSGPSRTADTYVRWCQSTASSNNSGRTYSNGAAVTTKKHNLINFSNYTNYVNYVNYNHFLQV
jgi:hypothetical protein